jgi:hypothetical protein
MNTLNLNLHCGGSVVSREQIAEVATPAPEGRWFPVSHSGLLGTIESELNKLNLVVTGETHALANENKRLFSILQVGSKDNPGSKDYSWVAGVRNSHDKSFPAGLCVGSAVFVCSNLAFSNEIVFGRRHTTNIMRDLPMLVARACGELASKWDTQGKRIEMYKNTELGNKDAAWILLNSLRQNVFPKTKIDDVLSEWLEPRHPEFKDRNVWSLFNAVTENLKPRENSKANSLWDLPARTNRLHALCDSACGLNFADLNTAELAAN